MTRLLLISLYSLFVLGFVSCAVSNSSYQSPNKSIDSDIITDPELARSRYLFIKSELLAKEGRGEEAIAALEAVNEAEKEKSPVVLAELAEAFLRAGKLQESLDHINKAIKLNSGNDDFLRFKAGVLSALGRGGEAIDVYKVLIAKADQSDDEAYLLLSGLYLQTGNTGGALATLESLVKRNENSVPARYYLAKLYTSLREFDKAEHAYQAVLKLQRSEPIELEYIKVLALNRKLDEATKYTQNLIKENPDSFKARELLGELLLGSEKVEEAIEVFQGAESLESDPSKMQLRIALLKLQIRDFEGAEQGFSLIIAENPKNDTARYYLATAIASQDRIGEALGLLRAIAPKSDLYKKARGFGAFLLREEDKFYEAIDLLEEACKEYPEDVELMGYKIAIYREIHDLDKAFEELKKISKIQPENDQHLFNLGVLEEERGNKSSSVEYMEEAVKLNPNNANALNYLGYSLAENNSDLGRAEDLVKKALLIEPTNGYFLDSLGWVFYQRGEYIKAVTYLEKAVKEVPADGLILMHLGEAYLKAGKNAEAKKILEKSLQHLELDEKETENGLKVKSLLETLK